MPDIIVIVLLCGAPPESLVPSLQARSLQPVASQSACMQVDVLSAQVWLWCVHAHADGCV